MGPGRTWTRASALGSQKKVTPDTHAALTGSAIRDREVSTTEPDPEHGAGESVPPREAEINVAVDAIRRRHTKKLNQRLACETVTPWPAASAERMLRLPPQARSGAVRASG